MFFFGMVLPDYREGDSVWPGRPVVDVIEAGGWSCARRWTRTTASNLVEGQEADVSVDALPGDLQGEGGRARRAREPRRSSRPRA
jgi:multidrug resistance efflux pump